MDLEAMITSSSASGFPQYMAEVCKNLDFEELMKTRMVSVTFYNFLMDKNQRCIWIQAMSKVFSIFIQDAFNLAKFPCVNFASRVSKESSYKKKWIEVFEKIKVTAIIPQLIKICLIIRETEIPLRNSVNQEFSRKHPLSILHEMSNIFKEQDGHLFEQIGGLSVTPKMLFYYSQALDKKKEEDKWIKLQANTIACLLLISFYIGAIYIICPNN